MYLNTCMCAVYLYTYIHVFKHICMCAVYLYTYIHVFKHTYACVLCSETPPNNHSGSTTTPLLRPPHCIYIYISDVELPVKLVWFQLHKRNN